MAALLAVGRGQIPRDLAAANEGRRRAPLAAVGDRLGMGGDGGTDEAGAQGGLQQNRAHGGRVHVLVFCEVDDW
jgi:hypothetical protein